MELLLGYSNSHSCGFWRRGAERRVIPGVSILGNADTPVFDFYVLL